MNASEPLMTHRQSPKNAVKTQSDPFSADQSEGNLLTVQMAAGVKAA